MLAVARDWLTLDQVIRLAGVTVWRRDVATVVARVRRQLESAGPRMRLTRTLRDELAGDQPAMARWHERIALSYLDGAPDWAALDWSRIDRYGLRHLATHLARAGRPTPTASSSWSRPELRRALIGAFGREAGIREFAAATALAAEHTRRELPFRQALPAAVYLTGIGAENFRTTPDVPPALVGLMTRLGRLDEALALLAALPPSVQRFQGVLAVLRNAPDERAEDVAEHVVDRGSRRTGRKGGSAWRGGGGAGAPRPGRARRLAALGDAPGDAAGAADAGAPGGRAGRGGHARGGRRRCSTGPTPSRSASTG